MTTESAQITNAQETVRKEKQRGASLVEYSILVALIAVVSIAAVRQLGTSISNQFNKLSKTVQTMTP